MDKQIHLQVTAEDIDQGDRSCGASCPIALALKRATGGQTAYVGQYEMIWSIRGTTYWARTPEQARDFIRWFDGYLGVNPMEIDLIPEPISTYWDTNESTRWLNAQIPNPNG